jgi:translation initiation factor IF-1
MLLRETVAVYCENHTEHTNPVPTSQETHYVSATETNRLMLFKETFAVYCESHTEHTNSFRTSQEAHYVSATETNRLMLFKETFTVYCESHSEHINQVPTSQEAHYVSATETSRLMLLKETVAVYCEDPYRTHNYSVWAGCRVSGVERLWHQLLLCFVDDIRLYRGITKCFYCQTCPSNNQ